MAKTKYNPLRIVGNDSGLVQEREEFLLPDDAYPVLQNAYCYREKLKRKRGKQFLGRLQRNLTSFATTNTTGATPLTVDLLNTLRATEPRAEIKPGSVTVFIDAGGGGSTSYTDNGDGTLSFAGGTYTISSATINYYSGNVTFNFTVVPGGGLTITSNLSYYPMLPVMGIEKREITRAYDRTVFFDQKYAYNFNATPREFEEWLPATSTTWNAHAGGVDAVDFFYSTNYWVSDSASGPFTTDGNKLLWVTNNTGQFLANMDPPRITDGTTWVSFNSGTWNRIDSTNYLTNWLTMAAFRGRMVVFNTYEGPSAAASQQYYNRIRWSTIGNPFIAYAAGPPSVGSWRDDVRGQGGFLDIPTAENITAIGFVRDNLVVFCETETWQLRYTGRSIAPFQIERVNTDLGSNGVKSPIPFDTSIFGLGSRGITNCDSYAATRIDFKIPNFVFQRQSNNNGPKRTQGIRDYVNQLAYWTFSYAPADSIWPTIRLIYNFENESWAIFEDSLTTLGIYRPQSSRTWLNTKLPWIKCNFNWLDRPSQTPQIVGGNQQGFVHFLDETTTNDASLSISGITGNDPDVTNVQAYNHNLQNGQIIQITDIITGTGFADLNEGVYMVDNAGSDTFDIYEYDSATGEFSAPNVHAAASYVGGGLIRVRDNFIIRSKKFNYLDDGFSFQLGFIDILLTATEPNTPGAISVNIYINYDDNTPTNKLPANAIVGTTPGVPDTFFNSVIPTTRADLNQVDGTKFWQRVFCATRANFITIEYTFSNAQMSGQEQRQNVQIDGQVLWIRRAGTLSQI